MLIEPFTNKSWRDQWPGNYLRERVGNIKGASPETVLAKRLESHHLPEDFLLNATVDCGRSLEKVYEEFLNKRAEMTLAGIEKLCEGDPII